MLNQIDPSKTLRANFTSEPAAKTNPNGHLCGRSKAAERAMILLGCYRKGEAADPEIYTAAVIDLLSRYPALVVEAVTEPSRGLPAKLKWLPTIAEIKEACEAEMAPIRRQEARDAAQREQAMRPPMLEDRSQRPTYDELVARCARDGLFIGRRGKGRHPPMSDAELSAFKAEHEISDEQWGDLPNASKAG